MIIRILQNTIFLPKSFVIHNYHYSIKYLKNNTNLIRDMSKLVKFLKQYVYMIKHKRGKTNMVVDTFSRIHTLYHNLENKSPRFCSHKKIVSMTISLRFLMSVQMGHT